MLISWNWLKQYVPLAMAHGELTDRLMMAGLNHESTEPAGDDWKIDLEITSNRPDCLGHLGIARETSVLFAVPLTIPAADVKATGPAVASLVKVSVQCPELCPRYTARLVRGVKVGPSPAWLVQRLATIGIASINNVVDITNYVLMECGQPLHAFDFGKLAGGEIIVRKPIAPAASQPEKIEAIDHHTYDLPADACVIADAKKAIAIGGVMGGAATEVSTQTRDVLIEAAQFAPMSIRNTARALNLHSDSSYRFERGTDPAGVDWASRRCCELILQLAGGELCAGVLDTAPYLPATDVIKLRFDQIKRILGIEVAPEEVARILKALGCEETHICGHCIKVIAPSWRRDLSREIDLIEEVARIHGYDKIPEDAAVKMVPSSRTTQDRVLEKVRHVLTAAGFDEALTPSTVAEEISAALSPWTDHAPLQCSVPVLRRADRLRRSVIPSLLEVRHTNESLGNPRIELFETARVYLPQTAGLPREDLLLAIASGRSLAEVRGALEAMLSAIAPHAELSSEEFAHELFDTAACRLLVGGQLWGILGQLSPAGRKKFDLRGAATVAEVGLATLLERAELIPKYAPISAFPAIDRDLNFVVDEAVRWADLATTVRTAAGEDLESLQYVETYRNEKDPQLGKGRKSLLLTLRLRQQGGTMTGEAADQIRERIVTACAEKHAAQLRA
jgi:phenylalanyl-tRNA synthetase beta chain